MELFLKIILTNKIRNKFMRLNKINNKQTDIYEKQSNDFSC